MSAQPQILYHYTSLDTLALILTNKTLCFNTLLNVDDVDEAKTSDLGTIGKYVYVSCWTDEADESIAMWQMYTPNMHGVRIQLPAFPFKEYHYSAGELHFTEDTTSYIDLKRVYDENKATVVARSPQLIPVTYTNDEALLYPKTRFGDSEADCEKGGRHELAGNQRRAVHYEFASLGKFKRDVWRFQKEWRYWMLMSPWGNQEMENATVDTHAEFLHRLEDETTKPPYERFFVELSDEAIAQIEIVFGPRMTDAEKILAKHLLRGCGLDGKWRESTLCIR